MMKYKVRLPNYEDDFSLIYYNFKEGLFIDMFVMLLESGSVGLEVGQGIVIEMFNDVRFWGCLSL